MLKNEKILVTGATGQVARTLTEQLNQNNEVWAAARFSDKKAKKALEDQGVKTVFLDMNESDMSALPQVDYVIHCGCNTFPATQDEAIRQNAEGTGFLMRHYKDAKAFFHMSSDSVYRETQDPAELISEDAVLGGFSVYAPHYAMSKLAAEGVVRYLARELNLPTIIARLDVAYGIHGHGGAPMALYEMMKHGMAYTRREDGDSYCCPIHEDDIAIQVQQLILKAGVPAETVNLGGDEVVTIEEMITYLEGLTGLTMKMETDKMATWGMKVVDPAKRQKLASHCKVSWKDGVKDVLMKRYPDAVPS